MSFTSEIPFTNTQPEVGITRLQPENKNTLLRTHHRFNLRKVPTFSYFCQSANVPGISISVVNQPTVFNPIKRPGGEVIQDQLNIRFLVDENFKNWREIFTWIKECSNYTDFSDYKSPELHLNSQATLHLLNSSNNPQVVIRFEGLFPVMLGGLNFDSTISDAEAQYCDASFAFTSFTVSDI